MCRKTFKEGKHVGRKVLFAWIILVVGLYIGSGCLQKKAEGAVDSLMRDPLSGLGAPPSEGWSEGFEWKMSWIRRANSSWLPRAVVGGRTKWSYSLTYFAPWPYPEMRGYLPEGGAVVSKEISGEYDRGVGFYPASETLLYESELGRASFFDVEYTLYGVKSTRKALVLFGELSRDELIRAYGCMPCFPGNLLPEDRDWTDKGAALVPAKTEKLQGSFALVFDPDTGFLQREWYWLWSERNPETQFRLRAEGLPKSLADVLSRSNAPTCAIDILYVRGGESSVPTRVLAQHRLEHREGHLRMKLSSGLWFLSNGIWIQEYDATGIARYALALLATDVCPVSGG